MSKWQHVQNALRTDSNIRISTLTLSLSIIFQNTKSMPVALDQFDLLTYHDYDNWAKTWVRTKSFKTETALKTKAEDLLKAKLGCMHDRHTCIFTCLKWNFT